MFLLLRRLRALRCLWCKALLLAARWTVLSQASGLPTVGKVTSFAAADCHLRDATVVPAASAAETTCTAHAGVSLLLSVFVVAIRT